jgi:hypothetical protein
MNSKKPLSALWGLEGGLVVRNLWNLTLGLGFWLRNLGSVVWKFVF